MSKSLSIIDFEGLVPQDAKLDYYGKKAAVILPNKIAIFLIDSEGNSKKISELSGHDGPVLHCSWAHPQFGSIIATAGVDGKVIIHRENHNNWEKVFTLSDHKQTVTSLSFNNHINTKNSLELIVGYADGKIFLINYTDSWSVQSELAHSLGVNSITWLNQRDSNNNSIATAFITTGNDNLIKLWEIQLTNQGEKIIEKETLEKAHSSAVLGVDVFYSEDSSKPDNLVSFDADDEVFFWRINSKNKDKGTIVEKAEPVKFANEQKPISITHIAWSRCGEYLAVSTLDSLYMYKNIDKEWVIYSGMNNEGGMVNYYEDNNSN